MKLIMAIIRPFQLDEVRTALVDLDVDGLTVSETRGYGRQRGQTEIYRGAEYAVDFQPRIKVEAIQLATNTGRIGGGKIFVLDTGHAVRIRTGETQSAAL